MLVLSATTYKKYIILFHLNVYFVSFLFRIYNANHGVCSRNISIIHDKLNKINHLLGKELRDVSPNCLFWSITIYCFDQFFLLKMLNDGLGRIDKGDKSFLQ